MNTLALMTTAMHSPMAALTYTGLKAEAPARRRRLRGRLRARAAQAPRMRVLYVRSLAAA